MYIRKSDKHNPNYLAKIVKLENLSKHPNADRLQISIVDNERIIVGINAKVGDYFVKFPVESVISEKILHNLSLYRDKKLNLDKEKTGFFEKNGRVRAIKLRDVISTGFLLELQKFADVYDLNVHKLKEMVGTEFDEVNGELVLKKYVVPKKEKSKGSGSNKNQPNKCKQLLIDNTVTLHVDTKNFRRNLEKIKPHDLISISYKIHGTSFHISNAPVKRDLKWYEKILKRFGVKIKTVNDDYNIIYGSRKTFKNDECNKGKGFYEVNIYKHLKDKISARVPKGYQIYGEIFGYLPDSESMIQKDYDYGCEVGTYSYIVYRVKKIDEFGNHIELSTQQIREFCSLYGLRAPYYFYYGYAKDLYKDLDAKDENWHEKFLANLERDFTEKKCFLSNNDVWEEGVVIRKEKLYEFEVYKLKSYNFLLAESKQLDSGNVEFES